MIQHDAESRARSTKRSLSKPQASDLLRILDIEHGLSGINDGFEAAGDSSYKYGKVVPSNDLWR
jgi:hypothetical protein